MKPRIYISEKGVFVVNEHGESMSLWTGGSVCVGMGNTMVNLEDCEVVIVRTERIKEGEA